MEITTNMHIDNELLDFILIAIAIGISTFIGIFIKKSWSTKPSNVMVK